MRIFTLGRFALVIDGTPHHFARKAQKRPIELLQALIAMGGREVSLLKLEDALWPDVPGASARQSLNMALHRLRKLINPESLHLAVGKLTLDPHRCWVDIWAFERRLRRIETLLHATAAPPAEMFLMVNEATDLLQGSFLGLESEQPWMLPLREKMRLRVRRLFTDLGRCCGQAGKCEEAIRVYRKALEVDPLAEEFYLRLMVCYAVLERHPEALAAYYYCRKNLFHRLDVLPSALTETLLHAIKQQDRSVLTAHCAACRTTTWS